MEFVAKPYKLFNQIQNYAWGTKNDEAFIPSLLGITPEKDKPYAELWIGAHPKASSKIKINNELISLGEFIFEFPNEILGKRIAAKFINKLPFLLKILSANQALSIQAHPDKKLAEILHQKDPEHYPDSNHKPEIAIAIDELTAITGFRHFEEIKSELAENPELYELMNFELVDKLQNRDGGKPEQLLREIYSHLCGVPEQKLIIVINQLLARIQKKTEKSEREYQFLEQYNLYGYDVGLLSFFIFNLVELKSDEAIFTGAGIPHAYIKGNIIECMANSDNVVRAGLTPKFKDLNTLLEMIDYKMEKIPVIKNKEAEEFKYKTEAEEFEITIFQSDSISREFQNNEIKILLLLEGKMEIIFNNEVLKFEKGESVLIPATLNNYKLISETKVKIVQAAVPE